MGRPTKLTREIVDKAKGYLRETMLGGEYAGDLPTEVGLCIYIGIHRDTSNQWRKLDTPLGREYSDTLEEVLQHQQYKLIGKGLTGDYNSPMAKMLLNVNHGMVEKQAKDITSGGKALPVPIIGALGEGVDVQTDDGAAQDPQAQ